MRTVVISTAQWNLSRRVALFDGKQNSSPPRLSIFASLLGGRETCIKGSTLPNPEGSSAVPMHTVRFWSMALVT